MGRIWAQNQGLKNQTMVQNDYCDVIGESNNGR
jgi:hypothetical protein